MFPLFHASPLVILIFLAFALPLRAADLPTAYILAGHLPAEIRPWITNATLTWDEAVTPGPLAPELAKKRLESIAPGTADLLLLNCESPTAFDLQALLVLARERKFTLIWFGSPDDDDPKSTTAEVLRQERVLSLDFAGFHKTWAGRLKAAPDVNPKFQAALADLFSEVLGQYGTVMASDNPAVTRVPLWPGEPPLYEDRGPEGFNDTGRVIRVSIPELTRFAPPAHGNGGAVIVFPGGGYGQMGYLRNAPEIAERLRPAGIAVLALKYRVGRGEAAPLLDAARAVRLIRFHAVEWGLDPERIGIAGISAGAHLSLNLATHATSGNPASQDPIERLSSRPAFVAVFSSWNHGKLESPFTFTARTPPVFLRHARDDAGFPLAEKIIAQLQSASVPLNYRYLDKGGHGAFDFAPGTPGQAWPDDLVLWLNDLRIVK